MRIVIADAVGELVQRGLADKNGSCIAQFLDHSGIVVGHEVGENLGPRSSANALRIDQIFEANRDAVQRAAIFALGNIAFGLARLLPCEIRGHSPKGVQARIELLDAGKGSVGRFDG